MYFFFFKQIKTEPQGEPGNKWAGQLDWAATMICRLFLSQKHYLLVNIFFLITAAAGNAFPFCTKVTQLKPLNNGTWKRTLPGVKWPATLPQCTEIMSARLQINLAILLLITREIINKLSHNACVVIADLQLASKQTSQQMQTVFQCGD